MISYDELGDLVKKFSRPFYLFLFNKNLITFDTLSKSKTNTNLQKGKLEKKKEWKRHKKRQTLKKEMQKNDWWSWVLHFHLW